MDKKLRQNRATWLEIKWENRAAITWLDDDVSWAHVRPRTTTTTVLQYNLYLPTQKQGRVLKTGQKQGRWRKMAKNRAKSGQSGAMVTISLIIIHCKQLFIASKLCLPHMISVVSFLQWLLKPCGPFSCYWGHTTSHAALFKCLFFSIYDSNTYWGQPKTYSWIQLLPW